MMADLDPISAAISAILGAATARGPDIVRAVPRLVRMAAGRRADTAAVSLSEGQARRVHAEAAAVEQQVTGRVLEMVDARLAAESADRQACEDARRADREARIHERETDRQECERSMDDREVRLRAEFRAELHQVVRRLRGPPTPPDGHPVLDDGPPIPPPTPSRISTGDLEIVDASVTPISGISIDPPKRR